MGLLSELIVTAKTYAQGVYPAFLYADRPSNGHLPVFCYHDISAKEFERHLRYLAENGYRTLNCDELAERLAGSHPRTSEGGSREVALTFDDGLSSFYTAVYPLLEKYKMKAIAYVAPAWLGRSGFLTWTQCREMHASRRVDVQSHSYAHARIVTSLDVTRVWQRSARSPIPWGVPGFDPIRERANLPCLPVLEGASLFSGRPAAVLPDDFWQTCVRCEADAATGTLLEKYRSLVQEHARSAVWTDGAQLCELMTEDLLRSRREIEAALPGHVVRHFAFPWHVNSSLAWEAVEAAGFVSAAIGLKSTDDSGGGYGRVGRVLRVNADFLPCLPGRSRSDFFRVLVGKTWRRARGRNVYGIAN